MTHETEVAVGVEKSDDEDETFPDGGLRAWIVVLGSFSLLFATFGFQTSVGLFQLHWSLNQLKEYSLSQIAWIPAVFVFLSLALSIQTGAIFDRYGARYILISGSIGYTATFFLLARCVHYWQFMLCLGVLGGSSSAAITTVGQGVISHWFKERRGQASGFAMVGSALGGIIFPLMLKSLLEKLGWMWAMQTVGFVILACLIVGNAFCRGRLSTTSATAMVDIRCFLDSKFNWLTVSVFGFELLLITGLGLIPTYAADANYGQGAGFYLITAMNVGSTFGRVLPSWLSDKCGRVNMLILMSISTLISILVLWLPFGRMSVVALYVFVVLYGFGTGSFVSLSMACIGQISKGADFGRWIGAMNSAVSIATLISIPIGSALQENIGSQGMILFLVGISIVATATCTIARAACLGYKWQWIVKV